MARNLLDMPEDVMSKIIEDIGIQAILTLRKVCHHLRNFIDNVKPDASLEDIWINGGFNNSIFVRYQFSRGFHYVTYEEHEEGCLVKNNNGGNGVLFKNEDFIITSMKDFESVVRHQKSVLKQFTLLVLTGKLLENMNRILESRVQPFKTEIFSAVHMDQNQLMSILPFLDSKTLKTLELRKLMGDLEIDQLVKLDQWKNVQHMILNCPVDYKYIRNFTHFTADNIDFKTTPFPDLVLLKNMFLQSTGF